MRKRPSGSSATRKLREFGYVMSPEFTINPWGLTGAFAVLTAWSLAAFLLRSAERDRLTVLFAIVLLVEGAVLVTASVGFVKLLNLSGPLDNWWSHHTADCLMLLVYPLFLAHALPQRFLRILRRPAAVPVLAVIATAVWATRFFTDFWLIALLLPLMFALAFLLAMHAVLLARTDLARRRALLFAVAFGLRDLSWGVLYTAAFLGVRSGSESTELFFDQLYAGSTLIYIPIVAYGILSVRLLNIRIQVRRGVRRGTLAAAFVAIFFLISEAAASVLSERFGTVIGLLGATLIVFLVSPLHRLSEWISGQVVRTNEGREYQAYRRLQMYAVAVEDAMAYGDIGPAQRTLLDRLRESLDMSPDDARRIESDLGLHAVAEQTAAS